MKGAKSEAGCAMGNRRKRVLRREARCLAVRLVMAPAYLVSRRAMLAVSALSFDLAATLTDPERCHR
ncbi:hypothetical protein C2I33_18070 [Ralstonia solanacearum]|nr:hypothetical protein C2I33_18070 [Ralstonia solanacearum]